MTDSPKQDKRKRPMYPVRMSQEMHEEVFAMAEEMGMLVNDVIVEAIKLGLETPGFLDNWQEKKRQQKIEELEAELLTLKLQE